VYGMQRTGEYVPRKPDSRLSDLGWVQAIYRIPMHVLFVCNGNVCRSAIAERLTTPSRSTTTART